METFLDISLLQRILNFALCLMLAPLLPGIVNRTKAVFAGRRGPPLFQLYHDIFKLMRKGAVYSRTCGWIFQLAPVTGLAALICACTLIPGAIDVSGSGIQNSARTSNALFAFGGDLILFIYLVAMARFSTVIGALDTGSSFEGMGASREVQFAIFSEPCLIFGLAALAINTGSLSLSVILSPTAGGLAAGASLPVIILVSAAFFAVFLSENCRVPFDDPNTHLELTMTHEVMVLDYSGPELGMILYGASLKFWIFSVVVVRTVLPVHGLGNLSAAIVFFAGLAAFAIAVGMVESLMARFRFLKVPQILIGAFALSLFAMILTIAGGSK